MERAATLRRDPSDHLARLLSFSALAILIAAFAAILIEGAARAPASATSDAQVERIERSSARLTAEITQLGPGIDSQAARRALRIALRANAAAAGELKRADAAGLPADARLAEAVASQARYLASVRAALDDRRTGD